MSSNQPQDNPSEQGKYAPQPFRTGVQSKWGMFGGGHDQSMAAPKPEQKKASTLPTDKKPYDTKVLRSGIFLNHDESFLKVKTTFDALNSSFRWPFARQAKEKAARLVWSAIHQPGEYATQQLLKAQRHPKLGPILKKWGLFELKEDKYSIDEFGLHAFASAVKIVKKEDRVKVLVRTPFVDTRVGDSVLLKKVATVIKLSRADVPVASGVSVG